MVSREGEKKEMNPSMFMLKQEWACLSWLQVGTIGLKLSQDHGTLYLGS